ncbi:MAG: hypothetical protein K6B68_17740 [Eubacterium sp.]|nr:hypothetical protein [Eubacterium sp.]
MTEELENREKNFNSEECISAEEAFTRIKEEIFSDMSEDEKLYHQHKKEFKEKVREIERREVDRITDENHKKYIETIKKEYMTRT